jgi:hypothetical protein
MGVAVCSCAVSARADPSNTRKAKKWSKNLDII